MELGTVVNLKNEQQYKRIHYSHLFGHGRVEQNRELRKGEKL